MRNYNVGIREIIRCYYFYFRRAVCMKRMIVACQVTDLMQAPWLSD